MQMHEPAQAAHGTGSNGVHVSVQYASLSAWSVGTRAMVAPFGSCYVP